MKYKARIELEFDKRPSRKDVMNRLFDILRDDNVEYELRKYNKDLWKILKRR
jgi:hypothetical protein